MKLILVSHNNGQWENSDQKYDDSEFGPLRFGGIIKRKNPDFSEQHIYSLLISQNSTKAPHQVIEIIQNDEEQILSASFNFLDYENWDRSLYKAGQYFLNKLQKVPNVVTMNSVTVKRIEDFMTQRSLDKGIGASFTLGTFECPPHFTLIVCLKESLPNHTFEVICDEQAHFVDSEE